MKRLRRLTVVEWLTILGVMLVLGGLLLPDSATTTRWRLEERARDFTSVSVARLADETIVAMDVDITGTWTCSHRLNRSEFTFSPRPDGQFNVDFSRSGCLGGCQLRRTASIDRGVIGLDAAVAEYLPRTYNTLYVIRVHGAVYLLPAEWLSDFERELDADAGGWEWYVFRRGNDANEPSNAPEHASRAFSNGQSTARAG
ncbi:hypothetical protein [Rhodopirellula baltica]|uniref:Uncharacterized protein n=1 Tax=Rhodopirellula baltica SWK14 TaxID=993516 RepID=L7CLX4_RHOBT|nr:hypothetical protein [Rhodopirellula baltica]ELP34622.1 hypothetical protein RBSWK_01454 [Rhodopirellula baltica SWK14]